MFDPLRFYIYTVELMIIVILIVARVEGLNANSQIVVSKSNENAVVHKTSIANSTTSNKLMNRIPINNPRAPPIEAMSGNSVIFDS